MLPGERRNRILELLIVNRAITVKELCDSLETSEATIRRDLTIMEEDGKLERTHGGAVLNMDEFLDNEEIYPKKEQMNSSEKAAIAAKAFEFIKENDSVLLDSGTTTLELARLIGKSDLKITVITNSTTCSSLLSNNPNVELILLGGKVRLNTLAVVGSTAVDMIKRFQVNKAFMAINAINLEDGLMTPDLEEAEIKRAMINSAKERFVLADYSKFKRLAMCKVAPVTMIDCVITDTQLDKTTIEKFELNEVKVIQVNF